MQNLVLKSKKLWTLILQKKSFIQFKLVSIYNFINNTSIKINLKYNYQKQKSRIELISKIKELSNYQDRMIRPKQSAKILPNPCLDEIKNPQRVRILILSEQKLSYQQFSYLKKFTNLIKLDLSHNRIITFTQGFSFKSLTQLKTLFLHYNKIDKIKNLQPLSDCNKLVYLTLFGNPIEETKARHFCVNLVSSLKLMDDKPVNEQQRNNGIFCFNIKHKNNERTGFPLIQMPSPQKGVQFLACVMREINIVKFQYLKVNPIVLIQKWWKSKLYKKRLYKQFLQQESINKLLLNRNQNKPSQVKNILKSECQESKKNMQHKFMNEDENNSHQDKSNHIYTTNQFNQNPKIKIINLFKTFFEGLNSIFLLHNHYPTLLCSKEYCVQNALSFKPIQTFNTKYLHLYIIPQKNSVYKLSKQKSKKFISLVFYNNTHYVLELKSKPEKQKSRLKNIYGQNQTKKSFSKTKQYVEIDLPKYQKLDLIKKQYLKSRTSQYKHSFQLLLGSYVIRINSAVKIQKIWKGYYVRKSLNILKKIRYQRAAKKIQKWLRNLKFQHRQSFLLKTYQFLKKNDSQNLVMALETFSKIVSKQKQKFLFGRLFKLPFQDQHFEIMQKNSPNQFDPDQVLTNVNSKKKYQIKLNYERQPFPNYFSKFAQSFNLQNSRSSDIDFQQRSLRIIDLLIKGISSIKKFQKTIQIKSEKKQQKIFIRFEYSNKNEANQRKLLLCMLTYSFRTQKWLQFYSQDIKPKVKHIEIQSQVKKNYFVKIVADTDKNQHLFDKLKYYTKSINYQGNLQWNPIKLRYYKGTTDYSAVLLCGLHKMDKQFEGKKKQAQHEQGDSNTYLQRKRLQQLKSLKTLHAKMALKNFDTQIITPSGSNWNAKQNLRSFSLNLKEESFPLDLTEVNYRYQKNLSHYNSLHHDNSQFSIDDSSILSKSLNYYGSSLPLKINLDQSQINDLSLSHDPLKDFKKSQISKTKSIHKEKIQLINEIRKKNQNSLRMEYYTQRQHNHRLLKQKSQTSLINNLNKVKKIQQKRKAKLQQSFQVDKFIRKGNLSIQNQMRRYEKSRSQSKQKFINQSKNNIKKSAKYQEQNFSQDKEQMPQVRKYLRQSIKKKILKTQLKQFSINLSDGVDFQNSLIVQNEIVNSSKKLSERQALSSAISEKMNKLYKQKRKQFFKSQGKELANEESSLNKNRKIIQNSSQFQENEMKKPYESPHQIYQRMIENEKRKQIKKKRTVHSVFPEEYYPLKDSHQIGFNLPKIHSQK